MKKGLKCLVLFSCQLIVTNKNYLLLFLYCIHLTAYSQADVDPGREVRSIVGYLSREIENPQILL
jgi:hypothetical protein